MSPKRQSPQIVLENGEPRAVIIPIEEYRELLERLEDLEDLRALEQMRKSKLTFSSLEEVLDKYERDVQGPSRAEG